MILKVLIRGLLVIVLLLCILATAGISLLLETKEFVFKSATEKPTQVIDKSPFPVSVDPVAQTIAEEDLLGGYEYETLATLSEEKEDWKAKVAAFFSKREWYQNLASPVGRVIVIWPGERKEEVALNAGTILRWNKEQRAEFMTLISDTEPVLSDGKFYPGQYVAHRGATPQEVANIINEKFTADVLSRYTPEVEAKVPLEDALIIASLLEREASDFENMREISGVIWNRLFIDMPLQLDATLQYVRGGKVSEKQWWPTPKPADKYLKSPFNTYANKGLPPAPISNPSAAAILAALNPRPTDCMYYFHDRKQGYHCSVTYEEHVRKLKQQYGRGK
ncbi:MAG TPA: endolytic transglycosylase MltG [Candidatus Paceibacterota bacterium]